MSNKNKKVNSLKPALRVGRSVLKGFSTLVIIALVVILGLNGVVCLGSVSDMYDYEEYSVSGQKADCIIVLGCGVNGYTPSLMLKDRLDTAIALYKDGAAGKILMSGDHGGQYYNEVGVMKTYAIQKGVPSSDIFMDHAGFSTYESLYRAKEVFSLKKIIAVTQQYHLYRTAYLAHSLDLEVSGVSAKKVRYGGQLYRDFREIFARDKDVFNALLKPEPVMPLGKKIDITGNGNVTNDDAFYHIAKIKGIAVD